MGKILETKQRILELLSSDKKSLTELRTELGLSPSTVSQHLKELESRGAIYLVANEHFRRYKYYRAIQRPA